MDILSTLFSQHSRRIGLLIPDVAISEQHNDTLQITEHPVELNAALADHAFVQPAELVMQVGFAGGGSLLDPINTAVIGLQAGLSPQETYQQLLELQASRVPFEVVTGKRLYRNMLIRVLEVTTDSASEQVLTATLTLREVQIAVTSALSVATKAKMAGGVSTSAVQNSGSKSLRPLGDGGHALPGRTS